METPAWFFDEMAHAGQEHLDTQYVATYDDKAGTDPAEDIAMLRDLGLNATHTLVDLGAGTGTFALAVAPFCRRVVAVDVSPVMLGRLREQARQRSIPNVECVAGGFLSYAHAGDPADFVYSRHALHHLPDFWKAVALSRVATLLKAGGVFHLRDLIFSCPLAEIGPVVEAWLAGAADDGAYGWTRAELETHLREEYSPFSWLLEPMFAQAGLAIHSAWHSPSRIYSAYTCIKQG